MITSTHTTLTMVSKASIFINVLNVESEKQRKASGWGTPVRWWQEETMIKIHTVGGNTYNYKGSYQEIQRAIKDVSCRYLYGLNRKNCRVIIPLAALDSIEEVEMSY